MKKQDGKVSVIVPLYNGEKHIEATIKSILHSSYGNLEVLVINDGSTDDSRTICEIGRASCRERVSSCV